MIALLLFVKASLVMGATLIVYLAIGRRVSAAARHGILTGAIVGLLLLPVLSIVLPSWVAFHVPDAAGAPPVVQPPSHDVGARAVAATAGESGAFGSWWMWIVAAYWSGTAFLLTRLVRQRAAARRLRSRATLMAAPAWARLLEECAREVGVCRVQLLRAGEHTMPTAIGTRRPAILLPSSADSWSAVRRRAILLHELAHVGRYDCLIQTLAAFACTLYWVHPAVWWVARRMRTEREIACDDRVLAGGISALTYADDLLELAYTLGDTRALAMSIGGRRDLERRLLALVDSTQHRATPARALRIAGAVATVVMMLAVSTSTIGAQGQIASSGQDQVSGLWEIRPGEAMGTVQLRLCHAELFSGFDLPIERLSGLSRQRLSEGGATVRLVVRRDAGTFTLDGRTDGFGASGTYEFVPDPQFVFDADRLGFPPPTPTAQAMWPGLGSWTHTLALLDIGLASLQAMKEQRGATLSWPEIVRTSELLQSSLVLRASTQAWAREPGDSAQKWRKQYDQHKRVLGLEGRLEAVWSEPGRIRVRSNGWC